MHSDISPQDDDLWQRLDQSRRQQGRGKEFDDLVEMFLTADVNRVAILKRALRGPGRHTAVFLLARLSIDELLPLFEELIVVASYGSGYVQAVRDAIVRLPRAWVLERIEQVADPLLDAGDYWEYRQILELYHLLDRELTLRLARRALAQADADIVEAAQDALEWFQND